MPVHLSWKQKVEALLRTVEVNVTHPGALAGMHPGPGMAQSIMLQREAAARQTRCRDLGSFDAAILGMMSHILPSEQGLFAGSGAIRHAAANCLGATQGQVILIMHKKRPTKLKRVEFQDLNGDYVTDWESRF